MEPFSITCPTCSTRLKVRSAAAIGQILNCPRCSSMVLVEPPSGAALPLSSDSGENRSAEQPLDQPAAESAPMAPATSRARWRDSQRATANSETDEVAPAAADLPESMADSGSVTADDAMAEVPVLPTDEWTSAATRQWQQWLLLGGAAGLGVVMAVAVFGWYIRASAPEQVVQQKELQANRSASGSETAPPATPSESEEPRPVADTETPDVPSQPPELPSVNSAEQGADESGAPPAAAGDATATAEDSESVPPGFADPDANVVSDAQLSETLAELNRLAPLLDSAAFSPAAAEPESDPSASEETATEPDSPVPSVNVRERLEDPIAAISFRETPLADFLQFLSQFSTIPISLDAEALSRVGVAAHQPVTVELQETTVQQVLEAAMDGLPLRSLVTDQHVHVTDDVEPDLLQAYNYDVADLAGEDTSQADELARLIRAVVAPSSWTANGGVGSLEIRAGRLQVQQTPQHAFLVKVLLEKLRAARGLPAQLALPAQHAGLEPRHALADMALDQPVKLNVFKSTPLPVVLHQLGRQAGIYLLVDWQAAAQRGWHPQLETTISVDNRPLREALDELLEPVRLSYRTIDAKTIEISTARTLYRRIDIEAYPAGDLMRGESDQEALRSRLAETLQLSLDDASNPVSLAYDPVSNSLLVAAPQKQQRQLLELLRTPGGIQQDP